MVRSVLALNVEKNEVVPYSVLVDPAVPYSTNYGTLRAVLSVRMPICSANTHAPRTRTQVLTACFRTATSSSTASPLVAFARKSVLAARSATSVSTTATAFEETTPFSSASSEGKSTASSPSHASTMMASKGWSDAGGKSFVCGPCLIFIRWALIKMFSKFREMSNCRI